MNHEPEETCKEGKFKGDGLNTYCEISLRSYSKSMSGNIKT